MEWSVFSRVLGVEVRFLDEGIYESRTVLLERIKGKLAIRESRECRGNLVQVLERIPKQYPIALSIGGKGIVHKNIDGSSGQSDVQRFQLAFPAISEKEFYVQVFSGETSGLISIARKVMMEDLLQKMKGSGLQVLSVNLGGIVTSHLWGHLNHEGNSISFDGHVITFDENWLFNAYQYLGQINSLVDTAQTDNIGKPAELVAYASALQLMLHDNAERIELDSGEIAADYLDYLEKGKLKRRGVFFLIGMFILLLISYVLYSHYNLENAALVQYAGRLNSSEEEKAQLQRSIRSSEQFLSSVNWNGGYNYGFLTDEIGKSKPRQIWLTSISFNDAKYQKGAEVSSNVVIQGGTTNLVAVNNWIFLLKERRWVSSVRLLDYKENPQEENYLFNILIQYGDIAKTGS
ncbi:MAG: hypothetical protein EOO45_00305 [Flavobacterium sp.]|nr:MAG: hypothetical protein EOO45_00305 [Flavobacterium sp.]